MGSSAGRATSAWGRTCSSAGGPLPHRTLRGELGRPCKVPYHITDTQKGDNPGDHQYHALRANNISMLPRWPQGSLPEMMVPFTVRHPVEKSEQLCSPASAASQSHEGSELTRPPTDSAVTMTRPHVPRSAPVVIGEWEAVGFWNSRRL